MTEKKVIKFTDSYIKALKPGAKRYEKTETAPRGEGGFIIRITPNGHKSWYYKYYLSGNNTPRYVHLGDYPNLGLSKAREEFRKYRSLRAEGIDPRENQLEQQREHRDTWTVTKLCDEYLKNYAARKKRPRSVREDKLNLARDVRKKWGNRRAKDITRGDIISLLDTIVERKAPVQANRTLATIRKMFAWGLEREAVKFNPASGISKPAKEKPKERHLSEDEIFNLWGVLTTHDNIPSPVRKTLQLLMITGCRAGEIVNARWDQIDGEWLDLSAEDTKTASPIRIHLPPLAKEIIGTKTTGSDDLLISRDGIKELKVYTLSAWIRRKKFFGLQENWSPHDIRRTVTTQLAKLGTPPHIIDRITNHKPQGITARVYDRHTYANEIKSASRAWSRQLERLINPNKINDKVINIK